MGGRNIDEHLYPAVHYNGFRASPIFVAIGAIGGRRIFFNFYYGEDSGDISESFVGTRNGARSKNKKGETDFHLFYN
jgi:hypothetical protein